VHPTALQPERRVDDPTVEGEAVEDEKVDVAEEGRRAELV